MEHDFPVTTTSKVQRVIISGRKNVAIHAWDTWVCFPKLCHGMAFIWAHHLQRALLRVTLDVDIGGACGWELSVLKSLLNPSKFELRNSIIANSSNWKISHCFCLNMNLKEVVHLCWGGTQGLSDVKCTLGRWVALFQFKELTLEHLFTHPKFKEVWKRLHNVEDFRNHGNHKNKLRNH